MILICSLSAPGLALIAPGQTTSAREALRRWRGPQAGLSLFRWRRKTRNFHEERPFPLMAGRGGLSFAARKLRGDSEETFQRRTDTGPFAEQTQPPNAYI